MVTYAVLSLLDFGLTLYAIQMGHREANPFLAWALGEGLFELAKLGGLLAVVGIGFALWRFRLARGLVQAGNLAMAGVFLYHMAFWVPQACAVLAAL